MLSLLHIENIAVIEQADITFDRGFNVLSGETGAGKSIIIDAISAILGERTYREVIRTGADKAYVSAVFSGIRQLDWFAQNHVPYEEELFIQREIFLDGRNICKVNGRGVSVSVLRALGSDLISIHGQHDSQQLFDEEQHLGFLDAFAGDAALLGRYRSLFEKVTACRREVDRLSMDESEKLRRQETLQYQINELEKADLKSGEDERLQARQKILVNAEKLMKSLNLSVDDLFGDEERDGAISALEQALHRLSGAARLDDTVASLLDKLQEISYNLVDVSEELRAHRDSFSDSEDELDQIGARLDLIHKLKRKYGADCDAMLAYLAKARQELDDIVFADEKLAQAKKRLEAAEQEAKTAADALHAFRVEAAGSMETRICQELEALNMPKVRFVCEFTEVPLCPSGTDALRFLMSANVGEALKPLSKVASGGELARIMLAIKNVMAQQDAISTMIFDEVDAGVSGRAAQKVAEKLLQVSQGRQVLCVTHLPQIAALADHHLLISKSQSGERTYTHVDPLDRRGRTKELARMIGGAQITETTLRSAEEMLQS